MHPLLDTDNDTGPRKAPYRSMPQQQKLSQNQHHSPTSVSNFIPGSP